MCILISLLLLVSTAVSMGFRSGVLIPFSHIKPEHSSLYFSCVTYKMGIIMIFSSPSQFGAIGNAVRSRKRFCAWESITE